LLAVDHGNDGYIFNRVMVGINGNLAGNTLEVFGGGQGLADGFRFGLAGAVDGIGQQVSGVVTQGGEGIRFAAVFSTLRLQNCNKKQVV